MSHIAVRVEGVPPAQGRYLLRPKDAFTRPPHSLDEARALAIQLHQRAIAEPHQFGVLARNSSEDPWTAEQGGSLGTVDAAILSPCFLDALTEMPDNSVSRVLQCEMGFHILYKAATPAEQRLSAQELVVGYREVSSWDLVTKVWRERDRSSARRMAVQLSRELRKDPTRFGSAVPEHSDSESALRGGYVSGVSTYLSNYRATELVALQKLANGMVSEPIETSRGFVIYRKLDYVAKPLVAMEEVLLPYDTTDPGAMQRVERMAYEMHRDVTEHPESFARLQARHCCIQGEQWELETRSPAIEEALLTVEPGHLVAHPVQAQDAFHILKRTAPSSTQPHPTLLQIERPSAVDVETLFSQATPDRVSDVTRRMRDDSIPVLTLSEIERAEYHAALTNLALKLEGAQSPEERVAALHDSRTQLSHLLGGERMQRYDNFVQSWLTNALMSSI